MNGEHNSTVLKVSAEWVRRVVVEAQRIPAVAGGGVYGDARGVLEGIGLIQLDPLMRVSTAQRLTSLTRLPRRHRVEQVDAALWDADHPVSFEAFTKVACLFPLQDWPLLELLRRTARRRGIERYPEALDPGVRQRIRSVVAEHPGGVRMGVIEDAMGSARTTGWNWSQIKQTAEYMVGMGELVITARDGVIRLFDLPERALPQQMHEAEELPEDELQAGLARRAAGTLAVMTVADFAHHYHLSQRDAANGIELAGLIPLAVDGWRERAYCLPELLESGASDLPRARGAGGESDGAQHAGGESVDSSARVGEAGIGSVKEARLIGPFDPLLRDRSRARRIFGFDYLFEAYVPKAKRVHGHYVMGVLSGTEFIGRVDLWRSHGELVVNRIFDEPKRGRSGVNRRGVVARAKAAAGTLGQQLGADPTFPALSTR